MKSPFLMPPIRILHVYPCLESGGLEMVIASIVRQLPAPEFTHRLLTWSPGNPEMEKRIIECGAEIIRLRHSGEGYPSVKEYRHALEQFFKECGRKGITYDAVHAHHHRYMQQVALAAARAGVPVRILHSHLDHQDVSILRRLLTRIAYLPHINGATDLIGCSRGALDWIFPLTAGKRTHILGNGIDTKRFLFDSQLRVIGRRRLLNQLSLSPHTRIFLNAGRCTGQKNQRFILDIADIWNRLYEASTGAIFIIIGEGPERENLIKEAQQRGLTNVLLPGYSSDVAKWMDMADAFLLPSLYEGSPLVAIEARASGLPVIVSDCISSDWDEALGEITALPIAKPELWARHLSLLPPLSESMRIEANRRFSMVPELRRFTQEGMGEQLARIYRYQR